MDYGEKQHFEDPRNNLNLENWASEHDHQNLGSRALVFGESPDKKRETPDESQNLEEDAILDTGPVQDNAAVLNPQETPAKFEELQTIIGNHFDSHVVAEISRAENELSQTGDINNFYEEIRAMSAIATEKWAA